MKKTFKEHFKIQPKSIDFINIPLEKDIEIFIDPFLIENTKQENSLSKKIYDRLESYLTKLNKEYVKTNKRNAGISFLSHLHEPNEIHFGYSKNNKGKAVAKEKASIIFDALRNNKFARQGLHTTNEAHNVLLLVKGIGQDIMSDFILNVCRDIFASFTENQIKKHQIKNIAKFNCEFYNSQIKQWDTKEFTLPIYNGKKIILIPKNIVSKKRAYNERYNWFIARNYISVEIMNKKTRTKKDDKFFRKLKDGTRKIIIKKIYETYRKPKDELIQFVLKYKGSLDEFVRYIKENFPEIKIDDLDI